MSEPRQAFHVAKRKRAAAGSIKRPEQALQQQVVSFIEHAYPGLLFFHVPNSSGNRGAHLGGILKSMGVKSGVPDLVLILPHGGTALIELKARAGRLSPNQIAFRDKARSLGAWWAEARSLTEVADILEGWLTPFGWTSRARVAA